MSLPCRQSCVYNLKEGNLTRMLNNGVLIIRTCFITFAWPDILKADIFLFFSKVRTSSSFSSASVGERVGQMESSELIKCWMDDQWSMSQRFVYKNKELYLLNWRLWLTTEIALLRFSFGVGFTFVHIIFSWLRDLLLTNWIRKKLNLQTSNLFF